MCVWGGAFFVINLLIFLSIKVFSCIFVPVLYFFLYFSDDIKAFHALSFDVTGPCLSAVCADIEISLPFTPIKPIDLISERVSERPGGVMGKH